MDSFRFVDDEIDIFNENKAEKAKTENLLPYEKIHVLLSFNPDIYPKIQEALEKLRDCEGVEYEQQAN